MEEITIERIPNDVLRIIFCCLSVKDLCNVSLVSPRFYMLTKKVWTTQEFDTIDNRNTISKIYVSSVITPDMMLNMMSLVKKVDDELKDEFISTCYPLLLEETTTAATHIFTFNELVALSKLYSSDIGLSISSKMHAFMVYMQNNTTDTLQKALQAFEDKQNAIFMNQLQGQPLVQINNVDLDEPNNIIDQSSQEEDEQNLIDQSSQEDDDIYL